MTFRDEGGVNFLLENQKLKCENELLRQQILEINDPGMERKQPSLDSYLDNLLGNLSPRGATFNVYKSGENGLPEDSKEEIVRMLHLQALSIENLMNVINDQREN